MAPVAAMFEAMRDLFETTPQGWTPVTQTVSSAAYNGNRSYTLTMSADVSATLSPGMRIKTTRTVTAPTQCTSLNGTTQYYNKTSPAGMTFTNNFTVMAWVKLTSYPTARSGIMTRFNGTTGWLMTCETNGTVSIQGIAATANEQYTTYQSLPLNKWVHVAMTLDMNGNAGTAYIDGVLVPGVYAQNTPGTALTQAGNLEIGSYNGANFFPGKIAQAAVFSAIITAATIRSYSSQTLSGAETSLISAYSFNGVITDLNATNANNLTAQGSAVATNADSPFGQDSNGVTAGTTDYALVMKVATTVATIQVPEGCTIPTSGGVSAVAYSTATSPFGFTLDKDRWAVECLVYTIISTSGTTINTVYNPGGINLTRPVGSWIVRGSLQWNQTSSVGTTSDTYCGLSLSPTVFIAGLTDASHRQYSTGYSTSPLVLFKSNHAIPSSGSAVANFYALIMYAAGTSTALTLRGAVSAANAYESSRIWAEPTGI